MIVNDCQLLLLQTLEPRKLRVFSPELLHGFWSKIKTKNPKIVVMSLTITTKNSEQEEVIWHPYYFCLAVAEHQFFGGTHFLILEPGSGKIRWLKKGTIPSEKVPLPMNTPARQETQVVFFHNFGNLLRPLELVPASCERVVPTEWQIRTVLGDCISRAKVIPTQAPQFRQYAI